MRERIITDDAVSTNYFIPLYFNDVINIFTKQCSAQRPSWGEHGYMGPRVGHYSSGTYSLHRVHTSIHLCQNIVQHTLYVHKFICIWVASASKGMVERNVQFFEGAVHSGLPVASVGTCARSRVITQKEHTPCTGFIRQYICTKTLSSATLYVHKFVCIWVASASKGMFERNIQFYEGAVLRGLPGASVGTCAHGWVITQKEHTPCTGFICPYICTKTLSSAQYMFTICLHLGNICLERHV